MSWPTGEQFDTAGQHGTEYALREIANGNDGPRESPLSGEWADDITTRDIARNVGFNEDVDSVLTDGTAWDELGDAWETSYFDTWRVELDRKHESAVTC